MESDMDSMMTKVTAKQVREWYRDNGFEVRITADGHVTYRSATAPLDIPWLEGRWVSEYRARGRDLHLA